MAAGGLRLAEMSRGYSLTAECRFLVALASLVAENGL